MASKGRPPVQILTFLRQERRHTAAAAFSDLSMRWVSWCVGSGMVRWRSAQWFIYICGGIGPSTILQAIRCYLLQ